MNIDLANIYKKRDAQSRSITAENYRGEKGKGGMADAKVMSKKFHPHPARELGPGWKVSAYIKLEAGETATIMDNDGPGVIRHMWITQACKFNRNVILRIYWEDDELPSVECPIGDFFCNSWNDRQNILSQPVNVNPWGGMNCFFPMPFRKHARISVWNDSAIELDNFFYTINYTLEPVAEDALYFHAQWRRTNPVPYGQYYCIIDGIEGQGQYVGTFMSWQQNNSGWWGEGEILMYLDGDDKYPTICGTGTEDYFGGAYGFMKDGYAHSYSAPYFGYQDIQQSENKPGYAGMNLRAGSRSTLYRFHIYDPIFFRNNLKIMMQCIGWRSEDRFLPLQDDVASVAYWYQTLPHAVFPQLPDRNGREII
ncbi:MAG: DUF2961 domain-containing protein [Clostridiales bacterium]|nr:DUF2961 domain-containing protein [Clostridiales bacterium]